MKGEVWTLIGSDKTDYPGVPGGTISYDFWQIAGTHNFVLQENRCGGVWGGSFVRLHRINCTLQEALDMANDIVAGNKLLPM